MSNELTLEPITEQALIPRFLRQYSGHSLDRDLGRHRDHTGDEFRLLINLVTVGVGVGLLSLLAQVAIVLPWTPVPITGQTFGVTLMSLLWGRKRGLAVIVSYVLLGALGLPVFALGKSGLSVGPTLGYLFGMIFAVYFMGTITDRGWCSSFLKTYLTSRFKFFSS